jgi:Family of unknown function (DUF6056)
MTALKVGFVGSALLHHHYPLAMENFKEVVLYRLQLQERERLVRNAIQEGHRDVVVPRLIRVPRTIHLGDLSEDQNHYHNRCYASYQGIDSIVARGDGDTSKIIREFKQNMRAQVSRFVPWK